MFDSNVLRVSNETLQIPCRPRQPLTLLQPTTPRCAIPGIPINPNTLILQTIIPVSNVVNFGGGVVNPAPTINIDLVRTMEIPKDLVIMTPSATPLATPIVEVVQQDSVVTPIATPIVEVVQQDPVVAIAVGASIAGLVVLLVLVLALLLGAICLIKKRERNQLNSKKKARSSVFERCESVHNEALLIRSL